MAKPLLKITARKLRSNGKSIKFIANKLLVSPSTVSLWCKDVELTKDQITQLQAQNHDPYYGKRLLNVIRQQKIREQKTKRLILEGKKEVGVLAFRDLFISGIALYWAEGFKKDNVVGFANSDPQMIKFFICWLKTCFGYTDDDIRVCISANISHEYRITEIQQFWSDYLKIPTYNFNKPFFQNTKWKKNYEHPEQYFGIARIRVRKSTDFLRKIKGYIEAFKSQPPQI